MYPINLHFLRYKNSLLGTQHDQSKIFAFIRSRDANIVKKNILNDNFKIYEHTKNNTYILNNGGASSQLKRPINKNSLHIECIDTILGLYRASVNSMELALIDEVHVNTSKTIIELYSNYTLETCDLEQEHKKMHLEQIFADEKIDYMLQLSNMIINNEKEES